MTSTSLDISGKISPDIVAIYRDVSLVANSLGTPIIVVGAAARDLVLHYGYSARISRATTDIDFGIQVQSVPTYEEIKRELIQIGFRATQTPHRLISRDGTAVDIVPFGPIAGEGYTVKLPPNESHEMNVLGFSEACEHADIVQIQSHPTLRISVASPPGLALLKLIAWTDRLVNIQKKDAADVRYLLENYDKIPAILDAIYSQEIILESYDWDVTLGGAHILGINARSIASHDTLALISNFLDGRMKDKNVDLLESEMCKNSMDDNESNHTEALFAAFVNGFMGNQASHGVSS